MKLPVQPKITEVSPGHFEVDKDGLQQYNDDMEKLKQEYDAAMAGNDGSFDDVFDRLINLLMK